MLGTAIARMRAAMLRGDAAGEQEQYQRREQLTNRLAQETARREALGAQEQARRDRIEAMAEDRAAQEAFRRAQLEQQAALAREAEAGRTERAKSEEQLRRDLAKQAEELRRSLARPAGAGGSGGGAGAPGVGGMAPPDASGERLLRSEFEREVSPHREIARGFQTVRSSASLGTPQGDLALMYGLVRMFDPGSVVREGEMATLQSSTSIPQSLRAELSRYIGEGRELPAEVRAKFVQVADRLASDQRASFRKTAEQTALRNMRYGIPSEAIISDPYAPVMGNDVGNLSGRRAAPTRATSRPPLSAFPGAKP